MNPVSHALVAKEVNPGASPAFIFGAMAPDFIKLSGQKRVLEVANTDLAAGIKMHLDTDRVFDSQPIFMELQSELGAELVEAIGRKAARASAHLATEMLLDGFSLQKMQAVEAFRMAMDAARQRDIAIGQLVVEPEAFVK